MNFQINALIPFPNSDRSINVTLYGENNTEFEAAMRTVRQYDLQISHSASPHLESLETSEDCARPYDPSTDIMRIAIQPKEVTYSGPTPEEQEIRNAHYRQMLDNVASQPPQATDWARPFKWDNVASQPRPVVTASVRPGRVMGVDLSGAGMEYASSPTVLRPMCDLAYKAWLKAYPDAKCFDLNSPQYEIQGRVLAAALEMSEVLEASELYRMRMAGISSASLGHLKDRETVVEFYKTPALDDVCKLYDAYMQTASALTEARQLNIQLQAQVDGFKSASLSGKAVDDLADAYEQQAAASADRLLAEVQAELGAIRSLAVKHGWSPSASGTGSLVGTLTDWLDKFAKLGVLYETQKSNLADLMGRNTALTEANAQFEQRGNRIQELATLAQNQARTIETNEKTIVKLNRKLQKLSAAK